jgi:hypothetical protein
MDFTAVVIEGFEQSLETFFSGRCQVYTTDKSGLVSSLSLLSNPADHIILEATMSKEPLGPVAPLRDDQWFNVIKWVTFATIEAEELGITSQNVEEMRDTSGDPVVQRLLGVDPPDHRLGDVAHVHPAGRHPALGATVGVAVDHEIGTGGNKLEALHHRAEKLRLQRLVFPALRVPRDLALQRSCHIQLPGLCHPLGVYGLCTVGQSSGFPLDAECGNDHLLAYNNG